MQLTFFRSTGWTGWDVAAEPAIPDRMPVLIDDDLLFEDAGVPRPSVAANRWLRARRRGRRHLRRRHGAAAAARGRHPVSHAAAGPRTPLASPFTRSQVCAAAGLAIIPGGKPVLFDQDAWHFGDVDGLPAQLVPARRRLDFTVIADPRWRLVAKEYIFARLAPAHPAVAVLAGAYRPSCWSCGRVRAGRTGWRG
jgi:hypothetical protein